MASSVRDRVAALLGDDGGVLRLEPAFVARDFLPPGRRLGLPEDAYDVGERGAICERWLASTTRADNRVGPPDEGLSGIVTGDGPLLLADAVAHAPDLLMGQEYAAAHPDGLGRLAKIFDYAYRLPFHVHPPQEYASLVGAHAKDEAYHFLPTDRGAHPESFLGLHPWIGNQAAHDVLLPYLEDWDSDLILRHSRAELQVPGEGFLIPSGVLHAPGTALTLELQEDSDVLSMFQALNAGAVISKELLFKDVRPEDRRNEGERFPLRFVDWAQNTDTYFYENHHLRPLPTSPRDIGPVPAGRVEEHWVFYGTEKFCGKRLTVEPGASVSVVEPGVYSVFVWSGQGEVAGHEVRGADPGLDELVISHQTATHPHQVRCTGVEPLVVFALFGPDLHDEVPSLGAATGLTTPEAARG
ncbi:MAG TPA: hypothetical protein VHW64_10800 [Nocardioides sp.]|uniref:hypothetical protein n=1 Tax=Nocardioides sp. TaxID=35761 RepID=UPI002E35283D|nr:hypothetical protein [Nocardioides sp.]HEX3931188.1 hypothetical protein [Nocardioides sp.]